jgi:dipeptidyl aminopeptidase/acylaminoacyl peptidase
MRTLIFAAGLGALASFFALVACGASPPPTTSTRVAPASSVAAPAAPSAPADAATPAYIGLGKGSVAPELIAKYAPPPLDPAIAHHIEAMIELRHPEPSVITSDGKSLFVNWSVTGVRQVWRIDGPEHEPIQMTGGSELTVVRAVTPDGRTIVVERDENGGETPGIYLQPASGGPLKVVQEKPGCQASVQFVSEDGRWLYFVANDKNPASFAVYRYDLASGARETVFDEDGTWEVSDHLPDGKLLLKKQTGNASAEYSEWDPAKHERRPLFGQGETEDYSAMYGGTTGDVVVRAPRGGEFYRLWRWKEGAFTAVSPEMKHDVDDVFQVDPTHQRILYLVNEDGYRRLRVLSATTYKPIADPKLPSAEIVELKKTSSNGRFSLFWLGSARAADTPYVYDWKAGRAAKWSTPSSPEIDVAHFAPSSLESYPARDGTKIPMWVRRPESCKKSASCPVIVQFHGGPELQAEPGFDVWGQAFIDAGFVFVEPNVRGSEGYGKTWLHADDGPKRLSVITDIEDASKYVRSAWAVGGKAPKVGVLGGSYGGYSALVGMTMFAGAYDAGVDIDGPSSLVTFIRNTSAYRRAERASEYGDPDRDLAAMTKLSPLTYADKVAGPILFIQGVSDPRVPVGETLQMRDALAARGVEAPLILFSDEGHFTSRRENLVQQLGQAIAFFRKHLE